MTRVLTDQITNTQYICKQKRHGEWVATKTQKLDDGTLIESNIGIVQEDPALLRFKVQFNDDALKEAESEFFSQDEALDYLWTKTTQHCYAREA